jgi:hypothetical protein
MTGASSLRARAARRPVDAAQELSIGLRPLLITLMTVGLILAASTLAGCSQSSPGTMSEARVPADGGDLGAAAGPELPRLVDWTCPKGWPTERVAQGTEVEHAVCVPPVQLACPEGQAQFLGEVACGPIGTACPPGDFLDETVIRQLAPGFTGTVRYAKAGGQRGSGTRGAPFGTVAQALSASSSGDVVALAKGTFAETVVLDRAIAVVGACVDGTTITPAPGTTEVSGVVQFQGGGGSRLANVRVTGPSIGIEMRNKGQGVSVEEVEVSKTQVSGIHAGGGGVGGTLVRVVVRDTQSRTDGQFGDGLFIVDGAQIKASGLLIERNREFGIGVGVQGARADLSDVVVRDTESHAGLKQRGIGLQVQDGGSVTLTRGLLERNRAEAVNVASEGTVVELADVTIRDTRSEEASQDYGEGLRIGGGTKVSVTRGVVDHNRRVGIYVARTAGRPAPTATFTDVVIRDTQPIEKTGAAGVGLAVYGGATVTVSRAVLERNCDVGVDIGVALESQAPTVELSDVVVSSTASDGEKQFGRGLNIQDQAQVGLNHILLLDNRESALFLGTSEDGGQQLYQASDIVIRGTKPARCAELPVTDPKCCVTAELRAGGGAGIAVLDGVQLDLRRFDVSESSLCGLLVACSGSAVLSDGAIHHNLIGANVQAPGYDMTKVMGPTVRYYGNETNLSLSELPLPAFTTGL